MTINFQACGIIGVLMGGYSSERDISLKSGTAVYNSLKIQGFNVVAVDITSSNSEEIRKQLIESGIDLGFIALHGTLGEDGKIQSILEEIGLPYTGSGIEASRTALNKITAHSVFIKNNILVPPYRVINSSNKFDPDEIISGLKGFPLVIKPAAEGSSIGVSIVKSYSEFQKGLEEAFKYSQFILVEKFIKGRELTVGILGETALPLVEIIPSREFFDFIAKYQKGLTEYVVPAIVPEDVSLRLKNLALEAHRALGCADISRVDIILAEDNRGYVLEVNTIPGFTATSLLPKAAQALNINFDQLCSALIKMAYGKKKTYNQNISLGN
ncbi:MAG: D-alanine--D-alanine ligase [Candidatus Omnitrophica bacterium]|nr:D-alanine--D-alanine ligase [Candidatus Omnitrophota bacterium]